MVLFNSFHYLWFPEEIITGEKFTAYGKMSVFAYCLLLNVTAADRIWKSAVARIVFQVLFLIYFPMPHTRTHAAFGVNVTLIHAAFGADTCQLTQDVESTLV